MGLLIKKSSFEIFQANASEGKVANLLFAAKFEAPSLRTVAVKRYLFATSKFTRPKNDSISDSENLESIGVTCVWVRERIVISAFQIRTSGIFLFP